ncbi:Monocarboxylate transporter 12 [Holothuria leucospilota]|uniref:Monocarboxylate transporter 12 n=1 Tax=Holothuria leucospilota TaxID=206669 RepID=A0A9Q1HEH2_HOLLE|nr:Monocarboxylate transporter 12 [Holothuria leucospilota]
MKANGVILAYTVRRFNTTNSSVSWVFTLQCAVAFLITPLGAFLLRTFSCRLLCLIGGLLAGGGYICAGLFTTSVWHLFVYHSLSGVGFGLMCIPNCLYIHANFGRKYTSIFAFGMAFIYVGVAVLPLTQQWLIDNYGHKWGVACFGGLVLNCVHIATLLRPTGKLNQLLSKSCQNTIPEVKLHFVDKYFLCFSAFLRHLNFAILMTFAMVGMFVYSSWALFLLSFGEAQGLSSLEAVYLSTTAGVGGILGSITASTLFAFDGMDGITCCLLPTLANGSCLLLSVFFQHFGTLSFLMFVSGFAQGLQYAGISGFIPALVCNFHVEQGLVASCVTEGIFYQIGGLAAGKTLSIRYFYVVFEHD